MAHVFLPLSPPPPPLPPRFLPFFENQELHIYLQHSTFNKDLLWSGVGMSQCLSTHSSCVFPHLGVCRGQQLKQIFSPGWGLWEKEGLGAS